MHARLSGLIERISARSVVVVGDAMLDVYTDGVSTRSSPEAAVPVIERRAQTRALGGAANVAANIAALGANVQFICVTGQDAARADMVALAQEGGLSTDVFVIDAARRSPASALSRWWAALHQ